MTPTWNNVDEVINQIRVTDNHDHIYVVICKWRQDQYNHDVHPALPLSPLLLREDRLDLVDTVVMLPSSFLMTNFCRVSRSDRVPAPLQTPRRERRQLLGAQWLPASFKIFLAFLGPRGPLRTPLVPVVCAKNSRNLSLFLFLQTLSSRNLSHSTQYTEHWTGSIRGPF